MTERTPLLAEFERPTLDQWKTEVERLLRGAPFARKMFTTTLEGLTVGSMATAADLPAGGSILSDRGRDNDWLVAQEIPLDDPGAFNEALLHELERGQDAVNLVLEGAGPRGTRIGHIADLGAALDGVDLTRTPLLIQAGAEHLRVAEDLWALCRDLAVDVTRLSGRVGCDPIAGLAVEGALPRPATKFYDELADLTRHAVSASPDLKTLPIYEDPWHDGGADAVLGLALTLSSAVGVLREMEARQVDLDDAAARVHFNLCVGTDFFTEIARLRALKVLWARVLEASGCRLRAPAVHVRTSRRTMTVLDPHVNMLRATTQAMSAVMGGVDSLHVAAYDEARGPADAFSRRIARNVQLVLRHECHFDQVADPAGGAWYVEKLTADLATKVWETFQEIESAGGVLAGLQDHSIQDRVAEAAAARAKRMATRREIQIGTNQYPDPNPIAEAPEVETPEGAIPLRRDGESFEKLRARVETMDGTPAGRVFTANLGDVAKYMPRLEFTRRFYRTGGFEVAGDGFATTAAEAVETARKDGARTVVLVGLDDTYAELAADVVAGLGAGPDAPVVMLAGAAPEGVEVESINIKSDVLETLDRLVARVGGVS